MKEFDYIILGGGLSGLTLAYELNKQGCLENKTLCILEKRKEYSSMYHLHSKNLDKQLKNWGNSQNHEGKS